ncbi:MAG: signal peptide peptidase SppA [Odoribacter sp.]|nr:signal peptide peptidase SppA [Odoribacter sp.]
MKTFLKYTLATIVGVIIVNILFFFILLGIIGSSMADKPVTVKDNSILKIKFDGQIVDRTSSNPLDNFDILSFKSTPSQGLNNILASIKKAAKDDRIKGIYLELTDIESNFGAFATVEEIRNALLEFKESGKFIYSFSNLGYSQRSYYLATVADSIFVNPETPVLLTGLASSISFYKNTLEKLGIQPEIIKVGKYKSAVEPFTSTEISDENREQVYTYMKSIWDTFLSGISKERNISVDTLNWLADNFKFYSPEEEMSYGLYDGVMYEDEVLKTLKTRFGLGENDNLYYTSLSDYHKVSVPEKSKTSGRDKIIVIYASGTIGLEQSATAIGPKLAETIRKAHKDKNTKAIVMRVNSPGGSALTSDIIWREVKLAAEKLPFIVSMGNVAASGGYYISCAADAIVADPTTLTGSIGIYGMLFSGEKLIKDKMGINTSVVKTNEHSDFGGSYPLPIPISNRPLTAYERNVLQNYIEKGYETFLSRVAEGRGMTRDEVHEVAQGRVWTGKDALEIGLVDVLGGLEDAIKIAAEKANLDNYKISELPIEKSPFEELFGGFSTQIKNNHLKKELGIFYNHYREIKEVLDMPQGMMARVPYDLTID